MIDPLDRIMSALDLLRSEGMDPVALSAWEEARDAVHEARERHGALIAVARTARDFVGLLYERALETGDEDLIALLTGADPEAGDEPADAPGTPASNRQEPPDLCNVPLPFRADRRTGTRR